jgi:hypothetical protein
MKSTLIIFAAIVGIIIGPLGVIWALNTLFPVVDIGYTFETWCAFKYKS